MRRGLDAGAFSRTELIGAHRQRIARLNPELNAIVDTWDEGEGGEGPLGGIPLTVKDSLDVAGRATVCGIEERRGHRATKDSLAVERLRRAGAVIVGKTNTPEWLLNWETFNDVYGVTRNPWDLTRTPGGSSGGESAAIAACLSAGGMGSDGGGSIRLPAALTGICGLKPTPGRVPATGHYPSVGHPGGLLGVIGPMARTVEDVELLFRAVAGHADSDPFSVPYGGGEARLPRKVGFVEQATVLSGLEFWKGERGKLEGVAWGRIYEVWRFFFLRVNAHLLGKPTPHTMEYFDAPEPSGMEMVGMLAARDALRARVLAMMDEFEVLVLPCPGRGAWKLGEFPGVDAMAPLTFANLLGLPALAIPVGLDAAGMPVAVQAVAKPWQEEMLLEFGKQVERERGVFPLAKGAGA